PRALLRRLLALQHAGEDLQRREYFGLRLGCRHLESPPDHRQRQKAPQHHGSAEGERQPAHAPAFPARPLAAGPAKPSAVIAMWMRTSASEVRGSVVLDREI